MANRSEPERMTAWENLLEAYRNLGLPESEGGIDEVTFFALPGKWTPSEFRDLLSEAA